MEGTRNLNNFNLLVKLMVLLHHVLFSLAIAANAKAILMQISAEQVPSLHRVASRYLKLVTSSNFWPLMLAFSLMLFTPLVIILFFLVLTSIPDAVALAMTV